MFIKSCPKCSPEVDFSAILVAMCDFGVSIGSPKATKIGQKSFQSCVWNLQGIPFAPRPTFGGLLDLEMCKKASILYQIQVAFLHTCYFILRAFFGKHHQDIPGTAWEYSSSGIGRAVEWQRNRPGRMYQKASLLYKIQLTVCIQVS